MKDRSRGFTLIELIVVIAIITILTALLSVLIVGAIERAKVNSTRVLLQVVDSACQAYRQEYNVYPPDDRGDSRCLHFYLGRERLLRKAVPDVGTGPTVKAPPFFEFPQDWLELSKGQVPDPNQPVALVDPWGSRIRYQVPGSYSKTGVDLWSPGKNLQDDLVGPGGVTDDVANWIKE
ncbi:MAG TPA: prepilin-type N-terminal cleavage/methylation domain-containing protein [Planctomycetota bacterium]|nr:prepilin-type N-terminal cleavage/methylation domain-containing protein [Planctomycetota bacterium]